MNWGFKNGDTSGGNCFMNSQTLSKANHTISIDSTKKRDVKFPNVSKMEYTGLQDDVDIDDMLSVSTLHQYVNMECNNEYHIPFINDKMSP